MYIESVPNRSSPPAILLRESYRDGGKIKKRTIANLSDWPTEIVEGLRTLLKGGKVAPAGQETIVVRRALPHGQDRALLDPSAVAIALPQQDGGRRVPVGHGFDIHGAIMPCSPQ